jgi:propionyl-CoA carboxylase alpha chain
MGEQAVALAKHVGYSSAGTVEFLVDKHRNFYFLEMNTRLQVEHPITEYITGIDLVEQMIRVAAGQPLSIKQEDVQLKGWAIESRVYAEDPEKYLPSIGRLSKYIEPTSTKGENEVRCDTGIVEGSEISIYYDPMICKLCTYGPTRDEAIERMKKALDSYVIKGVTHNIPLLREIVSHPKFGTGDITTKFLEQEYPEGFKGHALNSESLHELIGISAAVHAKREIRNRTWSDISSSIKAPKEWKLFVKVDNANDNLPLETQVKKIGETEFEVTIDGKPSNIKLDWKLESPLVNAQVDGRPITTQYLEPKALGFIMQHYGTKFNVTIHSEIQNHLSQYIKEKPKQDMNKFLISPMPGSIVSIAVKEGDVVSEGTELAVVEAMKMQNVLRATKVGKVKKIHAEVGASVAGEDIIIEFEDDSAAKQ